MARIVLVSCGKTKLSHKAKAKDLYIGTLFKYSFKYAKLLDPDKIFILSAKHELLCVEKEVEPYDKTLKGMTREERQEWATNVIDQLSKVVDLKQDEIIFLAAKEYRECLAPHITNYKIPMDGLRFGEQLGYLKKKTSNE